MSEIKNIPQVETDKVHISGTRARYTAYLQGMRRLEQKAKADKASREKAARVGGNV